MNDEERMEDCYRQMYAGMVAKDIQTLSQVLDDTFVLVHMTGMRQSKKEFIQAVECGTLNYFSAKHEHIDVQQADGRGALTGQSLVRAAVFGGEQHTWRLQLKLKLIRTGNAWTITEAIASTY